MKKPKTVKVVTEAAAKPCPKCGYCEHCGRSNQQITIAPYVAPYPYYVYPQWHYYPTWVSGTTRQFTMGNNLNQSSLGSMQNLASYEGNLGGLQGNISTALSGLQAAANMSLNA